MGFAENLKALPGVSHISAIQLLNREGEIVGTIQNKPGESGSLAVYNYLGQLYGAITADAARKGVELYAEHVADAQKHPGKHPNIDRLIAVAADGGTLRVKHVFAGGAAE